MCTVLTDAPLKTIPYKPIASNCEECKICENICRVKALKGKTWKVGISRNEIVDVFLCNTCFQYVVQCPWTQKYMNEKAHTTTYNLLLPCIKENFEIFTIFEKKKK